MSCDFSPKTGSLFLPRAMLLLSPQAEAAEAVLVICSLARGATVLRRTVVARQSLLRAQAAASVLSGSVSQPATAPPARAPTTAPQFRLSPSPMETRPIRR